MCGLLQETLFFFTSWKVGMCARFTNCTLAIIKPHALMGGITSVLISVAFTSEFVTAVRSAQKCMLGGRLNENRVLLQFRYTSITEKRKDLLA